MKRIIFVIAIVVLFSAQVFAQNAGTGVFRELSGTVEIKPAGSTNFVTANVGDTIARDTIVSTGFKSNALISVGSAVLTVRPLTRLSLAEISASAGTEAINVNLQTGRVRVDVNPPAGSNVNFSIQSPTATASVRGTSFEFDTQFITVLAGTVVFQGNSGAVMTVSAGNTSEITDGGKAQDPMVSSVAELAPPSFAGNDAFFQTVHTGGQSGELGQTGEFGEFVLKPELH